ncbi:T-cell surface glycoprotein CD4-like isoform X2 [Anarrhichthys ocellatus]|uniref:T-cell surface glycoprotein CD4-like isoform X2 n=1 Tax=Anarrhichthys ocellatus TaxID=433405 RepID=UPI0012EE9A76|nr:T-cell surface glycoprotein CD4-like isoform X2 [Anarrhichthys ocellatus]
MRNVIQSVVLLLAAVLRSKTGAVEVIYAQVGETATLKSPGDINQNEYVYWYFEKEDGLQLAWRNNMRGSSTTSDEPWTNRLSLSDTSLIIKDIQQNDFGTFLLKRTGDHHLATYKLLKVTVSVNPPSPLLPGDSLSLSCNAQTLPGLKGPEIQWLNPSGGKDEKSQGSLTVRATSQENGQWTCVVTYDKKENKAIVSVTVLDLSPAPLHPQYTSKSCPLTIPCSLPAHISWDQLKAKDIQDVRWHFVPESGLIPQSLFSLSLEDPLTWKANQDRGLRPVTDPKKKDLSLTRNRGTEEDKGDYVCALVFKNGVTVNRTVHVKVLQIISSPGTELISGQQLNLTCSLDHPLPSDLQLKWFPPKQSSLSSLTSDHHLAHLTIPEVVTGDGGKWRCELWQSNALLTSAEITLKIEPKMSLWMLVVICSVTVIVILLLILAFILYRRRQKMTHLRRRLCKCKTYVTTISWTREITQDTHSQSSALKHLATRCFMKKININQINICTLLFVALCLFP